MSGVHPTWERVISGCVGATIIGSGVHESGRVYFDLNNGQRLVIAPSSLKIAALFTLAAVSASATGEGEA